jgi:hypothetical protein
MKPMQTDSNPLLLVLSIISLVSAACDTGAARSGPAVRDSAGVQIVENESYYWGEGEGWRLSESPSLDIGLLEGDPNYQFYLVAGAARLSDGGIAVANSGTHEIRFYDAAGTFISSAGRKGGVRTVRRGLAHGLRLA